MGSLSIPLSGLNAAQQQLQAVSNNLANSGTTGYKDSSLTFSGIFSVAGSVNGSGDPVQIGSGAKTAASDTDFTEGSLNSTGNAANMAVSGNGFFLTRDALGHVNYTRAGDFHANAGGVLTTPNGQLVMGYPVAGGAVNTSGTLGPITVNSVNSPATTTSSFQIDANLNALASVGDTASSSLAVYDSLGAAHNLSISYTKTATGSWDYAVTIPNSDLSTGGSGSTQVASGHLNFDTSGNLVLAGTPPAKSIPVTLPPVSTPPTTFASGAATLTMDWNLEDANGNSTISQTAAASATSGTSQDGFASGTLTSYSVLPDGTVAALFTNGQTRPLGQVAVAGFANTQGLVSTGDGNYAATAASGQATVGVAGTGGRGTIVGGSVEGSNVNIATEFAKLIVAQQGYSANAKAITTLNQVSQAAMAMLQ